MGRFGRLPLGDGQIQTQEIMYLDNDWATALNQLL